MPSEHRPMSSPKPGHIPSAPSTLPGWNIALMHRSSQPLWRRAPSVQHVGLPEMVFFPQPMQRAHPASRGKAGLWLQPLWTSVLDARAGGGSWDSLVPSEAPSRACWAVVLLFLGASDAPAQANARGGVGNLWQASLTPWRERRWLWLCSPAATCLLPGKRFPSIPALLACGSSTLCRCTSAGASRQRAGFGVPLWLGRWSPCPVGAPWKQEEM